MKSVTAVASIALTKELLKQVDKAAKDEQRSRSQIIRHILERHFKAAQPLKA